MESADAERIVRLISTYQETLYRYVYALMPREQDARDVVQETCVAICRKFDEYNQSKPFLPWAYRFAYLEVLKFRQRNRRTATVLADDVVELLARQRADQSELLDARLRALEQCLGALPADDATLIRGRYQASLSIEELAERVEMSHRTLFRNLDRIRRRLHDCITRRLAAEGL